MQREISQGFTLIEVLVVIAIIGVLTAVFVSSVLNAKQAANNSAAQSYLRNAISLAEQSRANGDHTIEIAGADGVLCSAPSVWGQAFPQNIHACSVGQTNNGTVGYVTSSNGRSYQFNGSMIIASTEAVLPSLP